MKNVYCIVVTYNGAKWVDTCFSSLRNTDYPIKTIVIDNGSVDGTQSLIQEKFPEVEFIQSSSNLGFGKANNIGIQKALDNGADYVLLLNQDAYLFCGSFRSLIDAFEKEPSAGIISPIHLAGNRKDLDVGFRRCVGSKLLEDLENDEVKILYETAFVNAAAWVVKSNIVKEIGMFHPAFDHYGEDNEYVHRLKKSGYRLYISPFCTIVHDRPQVKTISQKDKKYAAKQKQGMLVKFSIGKMSKIQIDLKYLALISHSMLTFNFSYAKEILKNWFDLTQKIKNWESYSFNVREKEVFNETCKK